jgi:ribosomal-protein-alanine N-acetyltransferase
MNAVLKPEVRLEPLTEALLDDVLRIEKRAYAHPWTRGNFADSLKSGYQLLALMGGDTLIGYFVAMEGVEEVHLLNITVAPEHQGQGYAVLMLDALVLWSRQCQARCLWLEVRASNARALQVYERYGFRRVGVRKGYYPDHGRREDAVVMSLVL